MNIVTEIGEHVGTGVTNPIHAIIDNQKRVIIKDIENDETYIALFNELLGYEMCKHLEIRHPEFGVAHYKKDYTILKNDDLSERDFQENHLFTYTVYSNKIIPITSPKMVEDIPDYEIIKLLIFDIFISNTDRHQGNILIKMPGKSLSNPTLFPIDYTHILPGRCLWEDILRQDNYNVEDIIVEVLGVNFYQYLIENRKFDYEAIDIVGNELLRRFEVMNFSDVIDSIHPEILEKFNDYQISLLVTYLEYMRENYRVIIDALKKRIGRGE